MKGNSQINPAVGHWSIRFLLPALLLPGLAAHAGSTAPQDSIDSTPAVVLAPGDGDGPTFGRDRSEPVVSRNGTLCYTFIDTASQKRGIRLKAIPGTPAEDHADPDTGLIGEFVHPEWNSQIHHIALWDGKVGGDYQPPRVYACIEDSDGLKIHYVGEDAGESSEDESIYTSLEKWGHFGSNVESYFSADFRNYGRMALNDSGNYLFVNAYPASFVGGNPDPNAGKLLLFAAIPDIPSSDGPIAPGTRIGRINTHLDGDTEILADTLDGGIREFYLTTTEDGKDELWVRGHYGTVRFGWWGTRSQWFKKFVLEENEAGAWSGDVTHTGRFDMQGTEFAKVMQDRLFWGHGGSYGLHMVSREASFASDYTGRYWGLPENTEQALLARLEDGRLVYRNANFTQIQVYDSSIFRTFDPRAANAVPNPFVRRITERGPILDIDYIVEDPDALGGEVTVAALAFHGGTMAIPNAIRLQTYDGGTATGIGEVEANTEHTISWNAYEDWGKDLEAISADISVLVLARDDRQHLFDVHLVELPGEGFDPESGNFEIPPLTISRNALQEEDFTIQWLWLIARNYASIDFRENGTIWGTDGTYEGVQLTYADGNTTPAGRTFLLARDGLRVATSEEVERAKEGATPGSIIEMDPPRKIYTADRGARNPLPLKVNEYGIESKTSQNNGWVYTQIGHVLPQNLWHVVRIDD